MLQERHRVVQDVTARLRLTEAAIENAVSAVAELLGTLPEARASARISAVAGHAVFESLGAAMTGIIQARGHVVAAHGHLADVRDTYRMPVVDTGGGDQKPPRTGIEHAQLHAVA